MPVKRSWPPGPRWLLQAGLTAVFIGYLSVWLPHPSAGLSFLGFEVSEWVKFLPAVQAGQGVPSRDLFYLPPITLGLILALLTAGAGNRRWQSWAQRGLAVAVSWLAFPSLEAICCEPAGEWRPRLLLIGLVVVAAGLSSLAGRWPTAVTGLVAVAGLAGAALPTWAYLAVRPLVAQLLSTDIGIGPGVWLNAGGHLLVTAVALRSLIGQKGG